MKLVFSFSWPMLPAIHCYHRYAPTSYDPASLAGGHSCALDVRTVLFQRTAILGNFFSFCSCHHVSPWYHAENRWKWLTAKHKEPHLAPPILSEWRNTLGFYQVFIQSNDTGACAIFIPSSRKYREIWRKILTPGNHRNKSIQRQGKNSEWKRIAREVYSSRSYWISSSRARFTPIQSQQAKYRIKKCEIKRQNHRCRSSRSLDETPEA